MRAGTRTGKGLRAAAGWQLSLGRVLILGALVTPGLLACDGPIVGPGLEPPSRNGTLGTPAPASSPPALAFGNGGTPGVSAPTTPAAPTAAPGAPAATEAGGPAAMNGDAAAGAGGQMMAPMGPESTADPSAPTTPPPAAEPSATMTPSSGTSAVCATAAAQPMGVELALLPVLSAPASGVSDAWAPLRGALADFFVEPASADMLVSVLGSAPPPAGQSCPATLRTVTPASALPAASLDLDVGLRFATAVEGGVEPVRAAIEYAVRRQEQSPDLSTNLVILTDAPPTSCEGSAEEMGAATGLGQRGTVPVRSYVVAFGDYAMAYDQVAAAGGTDYARQVALEPGPLLETLRSIRRESRTCTFKLPDMTGGFDASLMRLRLRDAGGTTRVAAVPDRAACEGGEGFYFDRPENPTRLHACPMVCDELGEGAVLETETLCR